MFPSIIFEVKLRYLGRRRNTVRKLKKMCIRDRSMWRMSRSLMIP